IVVARFSLRVSPEAVLPLLPRVFSLIFDSLVGGRMDRLVVLPPIRSRVRSALMNLSDFKNISTTQSMEMAQSLPGGRKVDLPDRVTMIAFLLGTRSADFN